jgi:hypothetical protein
MAMVVVMPVMPVMLGKQSCTRRRKLRVILLSSAQAPADGTGTGVACAVQLRIIPTRRLPSGDLGLHLGQVGLALVRKRDAL